jgi:hypothetical protein
MAEMIMSFAVTGQIECPFWESSGCKRPSKRQTTEQMPTTAGHDRRRRKKKTGGMRLTIQMDSRILIHDLHFL